MFNSVYTAFRDKLVARTRSLKLGVNADCDLGPVINKKQHKNILLAIETAKSQGGTILCGGGIPTCAELAGGYYIQPTIIEGLKQSNELNCKELFGPVATLQPVDNLVEALNLANATDYGLTAAIHTRNVDRAMWFSHKVKAGVANINLGTFGSEPHMPFGGFGDSGNGTREPGVEALDIYSELKNISFFTRDYLI